jgi:glucokinase
LNGNILDEMHFNHQQSTAEESFAVLREAIQTLVQSPACAARRLLGVGIGVPGVTYPDNGVVDIAPSLDWFSFPLKERLSALFPYPIAIENDVNLAALGELWFGTDGAENNLVLITIGTGIGAGIIINGVIYPGKHHMAGEVGYLLPDRSCLGKPYTGFGAFEQAAAGPGVAARARKMLANDLPPEQLEALTSEDVFAAARQKMPWAMRVVDETVGYLAQALAAVALLYDPDVILLGGGVARSADLLIEPILAQLKGTIPFVPKIQASTLGYRAGVLGAIVTLLRMTSNYYILQKF